MAVKKIEVPQLGTVHLYKRRRAKTMRLSVTHAGDIRVSLPYWVPYRLGVEFVQNRSVWLQKHRPVPTRLVDGQQIGKAHRLVFRPTSSSRISSRLTSGGQIIIHYPAMLEPYGHLVQTAAEKASIRALKMQAEALLPQRLESLAKSKGFSYRSVQIKRLSSRWGSCSSSRDITLNCYLMQLPWHLIDYVLLHELTHTRVMAHGPAFWTELNGVVKDLPIIRKDMKKHQPRLFSADHNVLTPR